MRFTLALSALAMAISVGAIEVTEPKEGADIVASSSVDVKWTFVNTDETSLDIYLTNNAVYPPVNTKLATDISTSDGSYTVNVGNIASGHGYQISLKSDADHNTGILAQSNQFNVTESASSSTSSSSSSSTESSASSTTKSTTATSKDAVSTITSTGSSTTKTSTVAITSDAASTASGMKTAASSTTNSTAAATSTQSTGAGFAIAAHPVAALGVVGGALAFML